MRTHELNSKASRNLQLLLTSISASISATEKAKKQLAKTHAPDFRIFDFMRQDETGLSSCLSHLLDRNGKHGQGSTYFDLFVEMYGQHISWLNRTNNISYTVQTEFTTFNGRRLDILLNLNEHRLIGIENKPWANDQPNQLEDYAIHLSKTSNNWLLIYLCNREPSKESISMESLEKYKAQDRFLHITFDQLSEWLSDCLGKTKPILVRTFIEQLIFFIKETVNGELEMTEQENISDIILESPENIRSAFSALRTIDYIKKKLLEKLIDDATLKSKKPEIELEIEFSDGILTQKKYSGFEIKFPNLPSRQAFCLSFEFEFDRQSPSRLCWGIASTDGVISKNQEASKAINELMGDTFGTYHKTEWWPWYSYDFPTEFFSGLNLADWKTNDEPWLAIADGSFVNGIFELSKKIYLLFSENKKQDLLLH